MQTPLQNDLSLSQQPKLDLPKSEWILVISGWGGSGKTSFLVKTLHGLRDHLASVGAVVNERSQASVEVDAKKLPPEVSKFLLNGCACCAQFNDLVKQMETYRKENRLYVGIEHSPTSITGETVQGLRSKGFNATSVFLFDYQQFEDAPLIQLQGLRDADVIILTKISTSSAHLPSALRLIQETRSDLPKAPIFILPEANTPISPELWKALLKSAEDSRQRHLGDADVADVGDLASLTMPNKGGTVAPHAHSQIEGFSAAREKLIEDYSEKALFPYPNTTPEQLFATVQGFAAATGGVEITRVKGFLEDGTDVQITKRGKKWDLETRKYHSEFSAMISVRAFHKLDSQLASLAAHFGTPDLRPEYIDTICESYPGQQQLRKELSNGGSLPLAFEIDRELDQLIALAPAFPKIKEKEVSRAHLLGNALSRVLGAALTARLDILAVASSSKAPSPEIQQAAFDASDFLCKYAYSEALSGLFDKVPNLRALKNQICREGGAAATLVASFEHLTQIRFGGKHHLVPGEMARLGGVLAEAVALGHLTAGHRASVAEKISSMKDIPTVINRAQFLAALKG